MYIVELSFDDRDDRLALRPAHRELLSDLRDQGLLHMAGPYPDESGAMLLFNVDDPATVDKILDADPYYRAPGVTITRRQEWTPAVS